ncbi:hypothetical protein KO500_05560 [Cellulophaga baltica]|uniref:hypothetical protein n=1 Tax=Cellulophaga TaxID=104264 RepID=UPI001C069684|nr:MULTISPECIES: hypothetical protein [Cellulophaga]MBU2995888.1 hypothetical protein [Cellulophaga baltica]MDO6767283.1 hypothetical protein [Cellulophaga sp. 1_MG-2023]
MKNLVILLFVLLTASCSTKEPSIKVIHRGDDKKAIIKDSMSILSADLPIHIDSTAFLIHPIGKLKFYEKTRNYSLKSSFKYENVTNFSISNYNNYTFTGELTNLQFEQIGTNKLVPLTQKNLRITSANFLSDLYKKTGKKLFLYHVIDIDSNNDGKLDYDDIQTMYISKIDGSNFKKLVVDNSEIIDFNILTTVDRLYFKSIENTNGNDVFDKDDTIHYQYINLLDDTLEIVEYYPITN